MSRTTTNGPASRLATEPFPRRGRGLARVGPAATLLAMVATTLAAALARAAGVDFVVSADDEAIPLAGFAVVTGILSAVGVGIAAALQHWSDRPAERFLWIAVTLTAISLAPPVLADAEAITRAALVMLHLVAASVMIPSLAGALGSRDGSRPTRGRA